MTEAWLREIEGCVPTALRGFMEDRAPEEAGFLVDAVPRLIKAVRAVAALADEYSAIAARRDLTDAHRGTCATVATRLRSALAAALTEEVT